MRWRTLEDAAPSLVMTVCTQHPASDIDVPGVS